jgi:CRP/FNR family transcriptional regulator, cyclic AMP receptor protein
MRAMADRRGARSFLDGLALPELQALEQTAIPKRFPPGTTIFREGDRSDHVVIVTAGRVKIATLRQGSGETVLAERGAGDILGELSALDSRPRSADAVAIDEVTALSLTTDEFLAYLRGNPSAAVRLLELLTERLRAADAKVIEYGPS